MQSVKLTSSIDASLEGMTNYVNLMLFSLIYRTS